MSYTTELHASFKNSERFKFSYLGYFMNQGFPNVIMLTLKYTTPVENPEHAQISSFGNKQINLIFYRWVAKYSLTRKYNILR